ncbi:MAG: hypothetical protein LBE85_03630 [Candidatus Accumulibacter sp.]|jgi:hypothetical protein|nr:hypothetical protein [Accumulibacter sp.]
MNENDISITEGSINVFVDPGFDLVEAEVMKLRGGDDPHRPAAQGTRLDSG